MARVICLLWRRPPVWGHVSNSDWFNVHPEANRNAIETKGRERGEEKDYITLSKVPSLRGTFQRRIFCGDNFYYDPFTSKSVNLQLRMFMMRLITFHMMLNEHRVTN